MKVLHICSGDYYGGIEEVARLITSTIEKKHQIFSKVLYFQIDFKSEKYLLSKKIERIYFLYRYIKYQRKMKFDILHNHSGGLIIDLINLFLFPEAIAISHNHGCRLRKYINKSESKMKSNCKQLLAKYIYKKIIRISVSDHIHRLQQEFEDTDPKQNFLMPNPIDFNELNRREIDIINNYDFGYLGGIADYKGIKSLINLAVYLKKMGLKNTILICGVGSYSEQLKQAIDKNGLYDLVTFENIYVKKKDFFDRIRILISLPSFEPFGLTLYEAIYSGKPVITLQKESIDPKLHNFVWCLNRGTPKEILSVSEDINRNILQLASQHPEVQQYMLNNYSIEKYLNKLIPIYQNC